MDKALDTIEKNLESIKRVSNDEHTMEFWMIMLPAPVKWY